MAGRPRARKTKSGSGLLRFRGLAFGGLAVAAVAAGTYYLRGSQPATEALISSRMASKPNGPLIAMIGSGYSESSVPEFPGNL